MEIRGNSGSTSPTPSRELITGSETTKASAKDKLWLATSVDGGLKGHTVSLGPIGDPGNVRAAFEKVFQ